MTRIVEARQLGFAYGQSDRFVFQDVDFTVEEGELLLLVGPSGSGKSTLLRCVNGLIPHFHGGRFSGRVVVAGIDTRTRQPRDLAHAAGMVFQEPEAQTVGRVVDEEIAFGLENLGLARALIRKRLEEGLDALAIAHLRARKLSTLSGGELQRVAIAAVLTMQPRVLLLDEPTSQLDPQAADDVLHAVDNLRVDLGLTVMVAEHRLDRLVPHAQRIMHVPAVGAVRVQETRAALAELPYVPPVTAIGRALGWSPLPVSLADARRFVQRAPSSMSGAVTPGRRPVVAIVRDLRLRIGSIDALRGVSFELRAGEILALMGRNGAGKTSLLRALAGLAQPQAGQILFARDDHRDGRDRYRWLAFVAQNPASMLYHNSVAREVKDVLEGTRRTGSVDDALNEWMLGDKRDIHPADLSVGERQRAALAAMLVGNPELVLLDEPTRGMDTETKELLIRNLRRRSSAGACVVVASHDVELAARCADRVVLLADGEVIADGPAGEVLSESMTFSTQANKLLGGSVLTVEDALRVVSQDGTGDGATAGSTGRGTTT